MSRLVWTFREWPVAARIASAVLLAAVVLLGAVTAVLSGVATRHAGASPTTTLGTQAAGVPDGPLPVPSSTSTTSTTRPPGSPAPATSSTMQSAVAGAVTAPRPPSPATNTASTAQGAYCTAKVSDPTPPAGSPETVTIDSTSQHAPVSLRVLYQSPPGPQTYPQSGEPPVTTDAAGHASVTFTVAQQQAQQSQQSSAYPVVVEVNIASKTDECETHFVPSS